MYITLKQNHTNMFKKLTLILFFTSIFLNAQSTDIDKNYFQVNYVKLPKTPILEDANRTFSVVSLNSDILTQSFSQYYFESEIKLNGFTKLNTDAFLTVESKLIDVTIVSSDISREERSSTDSDGKVTRWTEYKAIVKYRTQGVVTVSSVDGEIKEVLNFNNEATKSSKWLNTYKEADLFRKRNNTKSLRIEFVKEVINITNNRIEKLFGYTDRKAKDYLWILDSKKHPENENHKKYYEIVKEAFSNMKSYESLDDIKNKVQPSIDYFNSILTKYPGKDRKSKKLRYASLYNIGWIYYYLDNPKMAKEYGAKIIENENSKSDGKKLISYGTLLEELFTTNDLNTRHLEIITEDKSDYYNLTGGDNNNDLNTPFDPKTDPDYSLSFVLTKAGDTVPGYVNITSINKLGKALKLFVKDLEGKSVLRVFTANEVKLLLLGNGEKRYTVPFKEAEDAVTMSTFGGSSHKYVKRLYTSKKISLYQYGQGELVILKKGAKKGYSTSGAGWLMSFRKKLNGLLGAECTALQERVKAKEFSNNADSIIEFMEAYNECE